MMYKNRGVTRPYSEEFKLKILSELNTQKYSKKKWGKIYGINPTTINKWIKKYHRKVVIHARSNLLYFYTSFRRNRTKNKFLPL